MAIAATHAALMRGGGTSRGSCGPCCSSLLPPKAALPLPCPAARMASTAVASSVLVQSAWSADIQDQAL